MANHKNKSTMQLERVADLVYQSLLETSDEEILKEALEDGINIDAEANHIRSIISDATFEIGKIKLAAAKKAFLERKASKAMPFNAFSLQKKREILESLKKKNALSKEVLLAARNEKDFSDSDLGAYLQGLYELEVIDDEGNALCD